MKIFQFLPMMTTSISWFLFSKTFKKFIFPIYWNIKYFKNIQSIKERYYKKSILLHIKVKLLTPSKVCKKLNTAKRQIVLLHRGSWRNNQINLNNLVWYNYEKTTGTHSANIPWNVFEQYLYLIIRSAIVGYYQRVFKKYSKKTIFNARAKSQVGNCKPISLILIFQKIFEHYLNTRITKYLQYKLWKNIWFTRRQINIGSISKS